MTRITTHETDLLILQIYNTTEAMHPSCLQISKHLLKHYGIDKSPSAVRYSLHRSSINLTPHAEVKLKTPMRPRFVKIDIKYGHSIYADATGSKLSDDKIIKLHNNK